MNNMNGNNSDVGVGGLLIGLLGEMAMGRGSATWLMLVAGCRL